MRMKCVAWSLGLALGLVATAGAAWTWHFETGTEGWVVADLRSGGPYYPPLAIYSASQSTEGGCEGGHLYRLDPSNNSFSFSLPTEQLPEGQNWSGGRLEFCLKSTHHTWTSEAYVLVVGGDGTVLKAPIPLPATSWNSYSLDLVAPSFLTMAGGVPGTTLFQTVMGQLEALYIMAEYGSAVQETTSLDEVRLVAACAPLEAPVVTATVVGTPSAPVLQLSWDEVPGAWSYEVLQLAEPWGTGISLGSSSASHWEWPLGSLESGFFQVRASCD